MLPNSLPGCRHLGPFGKKPRIHARHDQRLRPALHPGHRPFQQQRRWKGKRLFGHAGELEAERTAKRRRLYLDVALNQAELTRKVRAEAVRSLQRRSDNEAFLGVVSVSNTAPFFQWHGAASPDADAALDDV